MRVRVLSMIAIGSLVLGGLVGCTGGVYLDPIFGGVGWCETAVSSRAAERIATASPYVVSADGACAKSDEQIENLDVQRYYVSVLIRQSPTGIDVTWQDNGQQKVTELRDDLPAGELRAIACTAADAFFELAAEESFGLQFAIVGDENYNLGLNLTHQLDELGWEQFRADSLQFDSVIGGSVADVRLAC